MKDNKLIKQINRTNMKMGDVKKIVDIQSAKTLKSERTKLTLISSGKNPL